jgi:hypothetical protein
MVCSLPQSPMTARRQIPVLACDRARASTSSSLAAVGAGVGDTSSVEELQHEVRAPPVSASSHSLERGIGCPRVGRQTVLDR